MTAEVAATPLTLGLLFALAEPFKDPLGVSGSPIDSVIADLHADLFQP